MAKPKNPCPSCLFRTRCQQRSYGLTFRTNKIRSPPVISRDGVYHGFATDGIVVCKKSLPQSGRTRLGKSSASSAARRPGATLEAAAAPETGPDLLGMAFPLLIELALRPRDRPTRHGDSMAPAGLQAVLAMEVASTEGRPAKDRCRDSQADPPKSRDNPLWGTPRIRSELRLLGYEASKATVDKYRIRRRKPPSQTWRTFLDNHVRDIVADDFFTVPTATFRILFCFIVLRHHRRMVVHLNVTAHPTAHWTAQQFVEAFPFDKAPRFLLRDRDSIYGELFRQRIKNRGSKKLPRRHDLPGRIHTLNA